MGGEVGWGSQRCEFSRTESTLSVLLTVTRTFHVRGVARNAFHSLFVEESRTPANTA